MSPALPLATDSWTPLLGNFALQSTALLSLIWVVLRWPGRHWSAARRHTLLVGCVLALPCLIPAAWVMERGGFVWAWQVNETGNAPGSAETWRILPADKMPAPAAGVGSGSRATTSPDPAGPAPFPPLQRAAPLLAGLWLAGMGLGAGRLLIGLGILGACARSARRGSADAQDELERYRSIWTPRAKVRLLRGRSGEVPMTWGLLRHVIMLPPEAESWPPGRRRTVIRHELSHVARHDFLWLMLARFCGLCAWFHPLSWWLLREISRTAEQACDDHATRTGVNPASYAQDLLQVVAGCRGGRWSLVPPFRLALAMAASSQLRRRVEAILDPSRDRTSFSATQSRWLLPVWGAGVLLTASMTACRDKENQVSPALAEPQKETRVYQLSDAQRDLLIGQYQGVTSPAPGPVAGSGSTPAAVTPKMNPLKRQAEAALKHLLSSAHISYTQDAKPEVSMTDIRTLVVTTDPRTHDSIALYLARYESNEQVLISSRVLEVDAGWLPWRQMGLLEPQPNGQMQVQGILTGEQGRRLLEEIQKDSTIQSMTAAPSVTTRSGHRATVEMVRELIYPTEFDPPKVLNPPGPDGKPSTAPPVAGQPIMPTTPVSFEMRPVGVRLGYEPIILPGGIHNIALSWEITQFLGFVNYGTPIRTVSADREGKMHEVTLSPNKIGQPIFETMKISTSVQVPDGAFVVIGGLKPERKSPTPLDKDPAMAVPHPIPIPPGKPGMYVLILQATVQKRPETGGK